MASALKSILACLLHVFYKVKIHCNCSKCCESDCTMQTDNMSESSNNETNPKITTI